MPQDYENPKNSATQEEQGERPRINQNKASTYRVGDKVLWAAPGTRGTEGPYVVAKVIAAELYLLSDEGRSVNNNIGVPEEQLLPA